MQQLSPLRRTVGLVLIMIGGFWVALSLGYLEESFMTGQPVYTVIGAVVLVAGILVLVVRPKGTGASGEPAAGETAAGESAPGPEEKPDDRPTTETPQ